MVKGHNGPANIPLRRTMIKDTVGNVRKPAYDLPDSKNSKHIYGYQVKRDEEDAGQVLGKWIQSTPSPAVESTRSFVETNRRSLAAGCISAKQTREYANARPDIKEKPPQKKKNGYVPNNDTTYGIKSAASEDINELIQARHTKFTAGDREYPDLSTMTIKGKLPLPRETKCSMGKDKRLNGGYKSSVKKEVFKMTKFKNISPTMSTQPKHQKCQVSHETSSACYDDPIEYEDD